MILAWQQVQTCIKRQGWSIADGIFTPMNLRERASSNGRGIFRRFLGYITLALDIWEMKQEKGGSLIDVATVKEAVTTERLVEDMELELSDLFPKHSEPRTLAVKLLMFLEEQGPQKQSQLSASLDIEPYSLSRLLTKLEAARYVTRTREGTDKVVALKSTSRT